MEDNQVALKTNLKLVSLLIDLHCGLAASSLALAQALLNLPLPDRVIAI